MSTILAVLLGIVVFFAGVFLIIVAWEIAFRMHGFVERMFTKLFGEP